MEIFGDTLMFGSVRSAPDDLDLGDLEVKTGQDAIFAISEVMERQRRDVEERRAREDERCSARQREMTPDGVTWEFVIVDDAFARIVDCELPQGGLRELVVPDELGGHAVLELGAGSCEMLGGVERAVCADCIEAIGPSAFRMCRDLRVLVLPRMTANFDSSWINQCRKLEELVLPGMFERVGPEVFEVGELARLTIGVGTSSVEPGAFANSLLSEVHVAADNPFLATDCVSVFERVDASGDDGGLRLAAVAVAREEYEVPDGCVEIGAKAFACCGGLRRVSIGRDVRTIGAHAFARTELREVVLPASLQRIEKRAFFRCRELARVVLPAGLAEVDEEAFAQTGLAELRVPASVRHLACDCVRGTAVTCSGTDATLVIEDGGPLFLDAHGVLSGRIKSHVGSEDCFVLIGAMDPSLVEYDVAVGCVAIGERAFANMARLECVTLPEGLQVIGTAAFRGCRALRRVRFPETLNSIGDEAFLDTALEAVYLSADFAHLGELALVTAGARELNGTPTLTDVRVNPNCACFYHTGGLLCERMDDGASRVVLYDGSRPDVVIPREVDTLAPFSFGNATQLAALSIGTNVRHIQTRALNVNCLIERIHVDFLEPIEGHMCIDLHFPATFRSVNEIVRGFNSMTYLNPEALLARYDACVVNMHDYDAKSMAPIDLYGQLTRIVERLRDPLFLSENTRRRFGQILRDNLVEMCVAAARHDDRDSIDALVQLGYLDRVTLLPVIEAVGALQDAAMTGYLLEVRRGLADSGLDFEL